MTAPDFAQKGDDAVWVRSVLDTDTDFDAAFLIRQGPIDDLVGDERRVRNDDLGPLKGPYGARPKPNRPDLTDQLTDLDLVAHFERPTEHQDEPRHEVLHDVLKAETKADSERSCQHRQPVELNASGGQRENETEDQRNVIGAR